MNTNPESKRVLCFGDSNIWGYVSRSDHLRLPVNERWPGVLQKMLGERYEVIEEGLNSRAIYNDDPRPGKEGRNAMDYVLPCVDTHDPLDWIVVMLGTNELKYEYSLSPEQIAQAMGQLLQVILNRKSQCRDTRPQIVLISPPLANEYTDYCRSGNKYLQASEKSMRLGPLDQQTAENLHLYFIDASKMTQAGVDGVHMTPESHRKLGEAVAALLKEAEFSQSNVSRH